MSNHVLDQQFRRKLYDQSSAVPAGMWEAVQQQIPQTRRRRPVLWIVFGLLLLALAAFLVIRTQDAESTPGSADLSVVPSASETARHQTVSAEAVVVNNDQTRTTDNAVATVNDKQQFPAKDATQATSTGIEPVISLETHSSTSDDVPLTPEPTDEPSEPDVLTQAPEAVQPGILMADLRHLVSAVALTEELAIPTTDCYSFGKNGHGNLLVDIYAGPSMAFKSMTSRNEDVSDYIMSRDTTEFMRLGLHVGARVSYQHALGFFARIGAQYTQLNERFDYVNGSSTQVIITSDTIYDAGGNVIDIVLDTMVTSGTRIKKTYNRFHMIDIPVLVGYQIENGDWAYGVQAGPMFNIAFAKKGDILAPNGVPGSFSDEQASDYHPVFKDKLGLSVYGAAYLQKRVGEKLYAFIEPHVLHRLKSITLDNYPIDQRQTAVGLSIGARLKL